MRHASLSSLALGSMLLFGLSRCAVPHTEEVSPSSEQSLHSMSTTPSLGNSQANEDPLVEVKTGIIIEVDVYDDGEMIVATVKDEIGRLFITEPIHRDYATLGQSIEVRTINAVDEDTSPQHIVILCALGGPVTFGICLTVALVLITTAAY